MLMVNCSNVSYTNPTLVSELGVDKVLVTLQLLPTDDTFLRGVLLPDG